jgi:hypothetical protein
MKRIISTYPIDMASLAARQSISPRGDVEMVAAEYDQERRKLRRLLRIRGVATFREKASHASALHFMWKGGVYIIDDFGSMSLTPSLDQVLSFEMTGAG